MKLEHFIYGMFKGYGIKLIKSPGLNMMLNGEIIDYLCQLTTKKDADGYSNLWPNGVITITHIHSTHDEYGRNGVWNHTIAMRLMDYLAYMQPAKMLSSHFIVKLEKPPKQLKPITVT